MKKAIAAVALMGVAVGAQAATATLVSVTSYSKSGTSNWTINSAGTWDLDTGTGVATQTGGTLNMTTKVGATPLMSHTMTDGVLSSGAAAATDWKCVEGAFGGIVGAHICGNYNFGSNFTNESTYTPTATGATVTIGGDDMSLGAPQTLANSYSNLALSNVSGNTWMLSNGVVNVGGYDFTFNVVPVPAAVWLFGSALGLMGVARRRTAA